LIVALLPKGISSIKRSATIVIEKEIEKNIVAGADVK